MGRAIPIVLFVVATSFGAWAVLSGRERGHAERAATSRDGPEETLGEPPPGPVTPAAPKPPKTPVASAPEAPPAPRAVEPPPTPVDTFDPDEQDRRYQARKALRGKLSSPVASIGRMYGAVISLGVRARRQDLDCDAVAGALEETLGDGHGALEELDAHRETLTDADRVAFEEELDLRYRDTLVQVEATLNRFGDACRDHRAFQRALHAAGDARLTRN